MENSFTFVHEIYNKSDISVGFIQTEIDHDTLQGTLNAVPEGNIKSVDSLINWLHKRGIKAAKFYPASVII